MADLGSGLTDPITNPFGILDQYGAVSGATDGSPAINPSDTSGLVSGGVTMDANGNLTIDGIDPSTGLPQVFPQGSVTLSEAGTSTATPGPVNPITNQTAAQQQASYNSYLAQEQAAATGTGGAPNSLTPQGQSLAASGGIAGDIAAVFAGIGAAAKVAVGYSQPQYGVANTKGGIGYQQGTMGAIVPTTALSSSTIAIALLALGVVVIIMFKAKKG